MVRCLSLLNVVYLNVISMSKRSLEKMLTSNYSISWAFDRLRRFLKVLEQSITRNQSNYSEPSESSSPISQKSRDFEEKYDFFSFISPESIPAPSSMFYRSDWMILSWFAS